MIFRRFESADRNGAMHYMILMSNTIAMRILSIFRMLYIMVMTKYIVSN